MSMDALVQEKLDAWHRQIDEMEKPERDYFIAKAMTEHEEAKIILKQEGKSVAEKTLKAQASTEWYEIHSQLAHKTTEYNKRKRMLDKAPKEYEAEYQRYKRDMEAIAKHPI